MNKRKNNHISAEKLLATARQVMDNQIEAVAGVRNRLGKPFLNALEYLRACRGKVIVTGLGKSGIAAQKIAATLTSTGVPALFLHAAEALHGDIGVVTRDDVTIAISYSGETKELTELMPSFKKLGVPVIALTGNPDSALARVADCVLDVAVPSHAWPFGVLPTASVAATVAVGDALAVALLEIRGLREEDFALLHPGGLIGKKMLVRVADLMHRGSEIPMVRPEFGMREVLVEMTAKLLGMTCVVDEGGRLLGIITDGDLRRLLERFPNLLDRTAREVMTPTPKWIEPGQLAARALHVMESHAITSLPVLNGDRTVIGVIHMHDILKLETHP